MEAIGNGGGTQTTDTAGRFAFPNAVVGAYMVRTSLKGYVERRLMLEVERGRGMELTRYGSLSVCEVPRVRLAVGILEVGILNGERVMPPGEICSWNADEIAMIQFITGSSRRSARGPTRGATRVVIWERW